VKERKGERMKGQKEISRQVDRFLLLIVYYLIANRLFESAESLFYILQRLNYKIVFYIGKRYIFAT
jgi:hypothetical protein